MFEVTKNKIEKVSNCVKWGGGAYNLIVGYNPLISQKSEGKSVKLESEEYIGYASNFHCEVTQ